MFLPFSLPGFPPGPQGPGFGPGPGGPFGPPGFGPGPGATGQPPTAPPPAAVPQQSSPSLMAVDPGGIRGCLYRNTYIWLNNGESFWYYPTFVGRNSAAGFRWSGRFWYYFGIDLRRISSYSCFY
nr:collagen-like protein [Paenibacillus algicola]